MSLVVSWLGFPLVLGLLSLGCGLLIEQAAGPIRRSLLLPVGFSVIVVVGVLTTTNSATARLTTPIVISLAVAGLALSLPWRRPRVDWWAVAATAGAYASFGAPVILSGKATFAGYITLDDTATWLGMTDRLLTHGRNLTGLGPSTYEAALDWYWNTNGYPVGAFPPLGVVHALLGTDAAWLVQPYISFGGALLGLSLYAILGGLIESRPLRALAAFVGAQPALLYAYAMWGSVKELPAAALIAVVAALAPAALDERTPVRTVLPLATVCAAIIGILNFSGGAWIVPILLPLLAVGLRLRGRAFARLAAAFAAIAIVLSVPAVLSASGFLENTSSILTKETELGNLIGPLSRLQLFGIWPVGDFRLRPANMHLTYVLIAVVAASAVAGLWWAWTRRAWELAVYVVGTIVGCVAAVAVGSPWVDAKALAISSPAVVVAAMAGAAWLFRSGRAIEAGVVAAIVTGGVLWSNALAYHDVWLAPRDQLRELEAIGNRFAGDGPTLLTEYSVYGARYFLDRMDPEATSELRRRVIPLQNGQQVPKGGYADLDRLRLDGVLVYRTLVPMHTGSASRPPSVYNLVRSGRYYDVWQRPEDAPATIIEHLSLGDDVQASGVPRCKDVTRLARLAGENGGRLAVVFRPAATVLPLSGASRPSTWQADTRSGLLYPSRSGTLRANVSVPASGRYGVWLGGSFRRQLELSIDGRTVATRRHQLNHPGVYTPLGDIDLDAGRHAVSMRYSAANLRPGSGGVAFGLGPLVLSRYTDALPVRYVQPADARSLCGRQLDWVEAVKG
jgi:hypothetical protein